VHPFPIRGKKPVESPQNDHRADSTKEHSPQIMPTAVDVDSSVMAGLVPAIYDFHRKNKDMDGRDKPHMR
jgi:hypothetical protein